MPMNLWNSKDVEGTDATIGLKPEHEIISKFGVQGDVVKFSPTMSLGLVSEVDCFKAIKELGDAKFYLKKVISELAAKTSSNTNEMTKAALAIRQVHSNQLIIVNDVCKRFGVIHPELKNPTEEMLKTKTLYWDWYKEQHKKVYGSFPEILDK